MYILILILSFWFNLSAEITPYKFKEDPRKIVYQIPKEDRFVLKKDKNGIELDIIYYFTKPKEETFPIIVLCGGSYQKGGLYSIIHVHRYFLKEALDLGCALLTVENTGIDGSLINEKIFWENYTRSERFFDHEKVINHLRQKDVSKGWSGKIIWVGISEGGPLVTRLTESFPDVTLATIDFVGAGDFSWQDELWTFFTEFRINGPLIYRLWDKYYPHCFWGGSDVPRTRDEYDKLVKYIIDNPSVDKWMGGMTYLYHADAFTFPKHNFSKLIKPYLVVSGCLDSIIDSSDIFVAKAKKAGVPITYFRINNMDHYIINRPDIVYKAFDWLKDNL